MKTAALLMALGLASSLPGAAYAAQQPAITQSKGDYIPFADRDGIDTWHAEDASTVYFKDQHNRWYRATLIAPAHDLPYVENIGIDAGPTGTLDKFGAIVVKGQRYPFSSFVQVDGPPAKRHKADK